jgi:hypothetical protein
LAFEILSFRRFAAVLQVLSRAPYFTEENVEEKTPRRACVILEGMQTFERISSNPNQYRYTGVRLIAAVRAAMRQQSHALARCANSVLLGVSEVGLSVSAFVQ